MLPTPTLPTWDLGSGAADADSVAIYGIRCAPSECLGVNSVPPGQCRSCSAVPCSVSIHKHQRTVIFVGAAKHRNNARHNIWPKRCNHVDVGEGVEHLRCQGRCVQLGRVFNTSAEDCDVTLGAMKHAWLRVVVASPRCFSLGRA